MDLYGQVVALVQWVTCLAVSCETFQQNFKLIGVENCREAGLCTKLFSWLPTHPYYIYVCFE